MPNPYDIGSARLLSALGFEALATTSAGHAGTLGRMDMQISRDELLQHVAAMTASVAIWAAVTPSRSSSRMRDFGCSTSRRTCTSFPRCFLRGPEDVGLLASADEVLHEMTHPSKPGRRPSEGRKLNDTPDGTDEPAAIGSSWKP